MPLSTVAPIDSREPENRLDESVLATLRQVADCRTYPPGTVLATQGRHEHTFFVIESGEAIVSRVIEGEGERQLNRLGPLQFFGEMGLLDDRPRMATVRTVTEVTVLEVNEEVFDKLLSADPRLALQITRRVLSSMRQIDQQNIAELRARNELLQEAYLNLQAAQAQLVEKERLERELELAAEVQRTLLPAHLPQPPGYRFAAMLAPARHVGGDFYDAIQLDGDHVGVLIADVADKGLHASLVMAVTRTLFFQEAKRSLSPSEVACNVHYALMGVGGAADGGRDVFVTAFYGVIHLPTGRMTYIRAAQDRPLLIREGQTPQSLPGGGRFLGMLEDLSLDEYQIDLRPGDALLLFSDGVPDAQNDRLDNFGNERLVQTLQGAEALMPDDILRRVAAALADWTGETAPFDDITLLAVKLLPAGRAG